MPDWTGILNEIKEAEHIHDHLRRKYLRKLSELTGRNTIAYYSGWLQKKGLEGMEINDGDKNGFMTVIHGMDCEKGLDLLLHTQGGDIAATESLVDYLRAKFGTNIRAFIPQLALSAGTMIACACKVIIMGKQSSLGPIDPQLGTTPAQGVLEEFEKAKEEIKEDSSTIPLWQVIISRYPPAFLGQCENAIAWSKHIVGEWLRTGMFSEGNQRDTIKKIVDELSDSSRTKAHNRHLSIEKCKEIGLKVEHLEKSQKLQEAVLSVHHAFIHTLSGTPASKIIENDNERALIQIARVVQQS